MKPIDPRQAPHAFLRHLYEVAVRRALPLFTLGAHLPAPPQPGGRVVVMGAGKAAGAMAQALEALWPQHAAQHGRAGLALGGMVVTRDGHTPPRPPHLPTTPAIEIVEASHPVPDAAGLAAAERMLASVSGLGPDDLVICLMSGGASALLTLPVEGLAFADKQRINRELLASGANIHEMNCVRKHLSRIKGGRLAAACAPARVVTLAISDVPGDDPSVIGSGPTVPDGTRCADALQILKRYGIDPGSLAAQMLAQDRWETPKPGDRLFAEHTVQVIATPQHSLVAAAEAARAAGLQAHVLADDIEGESREVAKVHAALARAVAKGQGAFARPCVILSGGETTVTVRPQVASCTHRARGGRAGEFCLGLALALQGQPGVWALAADTDGIDGIEHNAGAVVAPDTLSRAQTLGLGAQAHLDRNDAFTFFEALGDLLVTGPTHTNVNDFRALLVL